MKFFYFAFQIFKAFKLMNLLQFFGCERYLAVIIIIIDNRGLNARWCLTPFLLSLPTAAYLGQRGLTPAGLSNTTAQCHLTCHMSSK